MATDSTTAFIAPWKVDHLPIFGLYPYVIIDDVFVSPPSTGILATIPLAGVAWYLPPSGIIIVLPPIVLSNFSTSPLCEQVLRSDIAARYLSSIVSNWLVRLVKSTYPDSGSIPSTLISVSCFDPFVSRKALLIFTISLPFQYILR